MNYTYKTLVFLVLLCAGQLASAQNFITQWNLATTGSGPTQITFGTATSGTVNYTWQEISPGTASGSGSWSGATLTITGLPAGATIRLQIAPTNFQRIIMSVSSDRPRLTLVEQWGSTAWISMQDAFLACANLQVTATDVPNLTGVNNMSQMFRQCANLNTPSNINSWNTAAVTNMSLMFFGASAFNQDIGSWNTSAVTNMQGMFRDARDFNQNIGSWNVAAVTTMAEMFENADAFNNGGSNSINNWNTGAVTNMSQMFFAANAFNQEIGGWNTALVTRMDDMFQATPFNNGGSSSINNWNTGAVTTMEGMFWSAGAFNQNIGSWNTGAVTNMSGMFLNASSFNNGGSNTINNWNTGAVTNMREMFRGCSAFNQNIGSWNTSAVTTMQGMFFQASTFNQNIGSWNTVSVTNMSQMFASATAFNNGGVNSINNWNTGAVTNMIGMFNNATAFNQNIGAWNTAAVTNMSGMFVDASAFNQNIGLWSTAAVTNMAQMFLSATSFNQNIGSWNTGSVTSMASMFLSATSFNQNISFWNTTSVTTMVAMFNNATAFNQNLGAWTLNAGVGLSNMFLNSGLDCNNYSATLIGWNANPLTPNGRTLGTTGRQYGTNAVAARTNLTTTKGWTITGDTPSGTACVLASPFITVWNLTTAGSGATQLSFGTATSGTVNYTWQEISPGTASGIGSWSGSTLLITGLPTGATIRLQIAPTNFQRIIMAVGPDRNRLTQVEQWGSTVWTSMENAFWACANLQVTATDVPNLSGVTNMSQMFRQCTNLNSPSNINSWNTASVTNMSGMFNGAFAFNQNIGSWNTSAVTNMQGMFWAASAFNQNIGSWNTAAVTNMAEMFFEANAFNNGGSNTINNWNTGAVTSMYQMFYEADVFNQEIGAWNTAAVTTMNGMFYASAFNNGGSPSINNWSTGAVTDIQGMFRAASAFNQNIGSWNTSAVTNMYWMFFLASSFNNGGSNSINNWNTTAVTNMREMFSGAIAFNQNIGSWNTSAVTTMYGMFYNASVFNQNIGAWITSSVTDMGLMFGGAIAFNNGGSNSINNWNTGAVTNLGGMFQGATVFNQNIGSWNTVSVTNMSFMFWQASAFNQNIGSWNTASVTNMTQMFNAASAFNRDIGAWNTGAVTSMASMFAFASSFNQNISLWNTSSVTSMLGMFQSATAFNQNIGAWTLNPGVSLFNMFLNSGIDCNNYSAILIGWNANPVTPNSRTLGTTGRQYGTNAVAARAGLIAKSWTILGDTPSGTVCDATPTITSFTPTSGPIGTTVTITGTNFSTTPANNIVYFGSTKATVTAATSTQLTVTVPTGATYQPITVQMAGLTAYSSKRFFPTFLGGGSIDVCSFARKDFAAGLNPLGMMIRDFDGDGKGDIAITEVFSYQLSIYKNTSTIGVIDASTLSTPVSLATLPINPWSVSSGDIDGDGKPDLVIANSLGSSISIYRNTSTPGTISFEPKVDFAAGVAPWRTVVIDIDGDGKPEIVVSNRFSNSVVVYKNTSSTGSFSATTLASPVSFSTGTEPFDVSVGDLNGDDKPDIVALNNVSNTISVFQNTTTSGVINSSSFSVKVDFPLGGTPYGLALADIDGDTKLDILATNSYANSTISVLQNVSGATINASSFSPKVDFSVGLTPAHFGLADFNGDGKLDLAVSNSASNTLTLLMNTASVGSITSTSFAAGVNIASLLNPAGIAAGDIDGDGRPEIAVGNFLSSSLSIYQNLVGLINPPTIASFTPSGAIGSSVTVTGTNFSTPFSNTVSFNGVPATITASTATTLTVTVPVGATSGPLNVTVGCNTVNAGNFTVTLPQNFITQWNLATPGSGPTQLSFGTATSGTVNYTWQEISPGSATGSGSWSGSTLTITGLPVGATIRLEIAPTNFQQIFINNGTDRNRLTQVSQWGSIAWTSMRAAFYGSANLQITATDAPILSGVTDLSFMFRECTNLNSPININTWNMSAAVDMLEMFRGTSAFNQNIGSWNTAAVTNMQGMFFQATAFNNGGSASIGNWNTTAVTNMAAMFQGASVFNQDIGLWNTAAVTGMQGMFNQAIVFNQNIGSWNTGAVTNMRDMFFGATAFNNGGSGSINNWNTAAVTNMDVMFQDAPAFDQNIGAWNTGAVTSMAAMFLGASSFNNGGSASIGNWNTAAVTTMELMFQGASVFNQNIGLWNTGAVTNMRVMFYQASAFNNGGNGSIGNWNTAAVARMDIMFQEAIAFNQNIGAWNTATVTNMAFMFRGASAFNNGGNASIGNWNTGAVTDMSGMFSFTPFNQNIGTWNTAAVTNMEAMFAFNNTFNQNIGSWNTAAVTNMGVMFQAATAFNQNIGTWNTAAVTRMVTMFNGATAFNNGGNGSINGWSTGAVTDMSLMFEGASAFNQNIGTWTLNSGVNLNNMLDNSGMNCSNYSATLIGWSANPSNPNGRSLGANGRQYGTNAVAARTNLTTTKGWTITGDAPSGVFCGSVPAPTIASFTPPSGLIGSPVTITGTNFDLTPANNIVEFNGTTAVVTASTPTSITTTVPLGATNGTITVTIGGNTATSATPFCIIPAAPTLPVNGSSCGAGAVTVSVSGATNGQYRWYTLPSGGTAIPGETNSSYTTPSISATTFYYAAINNGTCESARTLVTATINPIPTAPSSPVNGSFCGSGAITLSVTGGTNGQYRWYTLPTGGTAIPGETNSSYTTPTLSATTTYYAALNISGCESSTRTAVTATIDPLPAAPAATSANRCGPGSVTLTAAGGTAGQYRWYTVATGSTSITGQTNASFVTPSISATTIYYVSIGNGTCESARTAITATINAVPTKPVITPSGTLALCAGQSVVLSAPAGFSYLWSNGSSAQQITVTTAGSFTVVVSNVNCSSVPSDAVVTTTAVCNQPPVITTSSSSTAVESKVSINLAQLISDPDNNLDLTTLRVVGVPKSRAVATIVNGVLLIDYSGVSFAGLDEIIIEVCDLAGVCVRQTILIEVIGEVVVYNGLSANDDLLNAAFILRYIELLPETQQNTVSIYNRWGDEVWQGVNYNNTSVVFTGLNKNGNVLPSGTYFYKVEFASRKKTITGYLSLKR